MSPRGPKNPDDYRIEVRRSRHYWDELPADDLRPEGPMDPDKRTKLALPAQSTIMKAIPTDALLYWAVGKTAEYAVDEREKWERLDREDAVALLKTAHRKASGKAADRGSDLHEYLDAKLRGEEYDVFHLHEDAVPYVPVVDAFIAEQEPELVLAEVVGIGEGHGVTTDAVLRLPHFGGGLEVVDWKTRNTTVKKPHVVYEKEVAQLGANLDLRYWIVEDAETGVPSRMALPEGMGAVLVTFTPTAYALHRVDAEQAVAGFGDVFAWWHGMKRLPKAAAKPVIFEVKIAPTVEPSTAAPAEQGTEAGSGAPSVSTIAEDEDALSAELELLDRLRTRITKLLDAGHEDALLARWPDDVPGLSDAAPIHYDRIGKALDRTEADVGAPFDPEPTEPVERPKSEPAPVIPTIDEGPEVGEDDVETVAKGWILLEPDGEQWIADLAGRAGNLSLSQRQSARRARIGWALVRLGVAGWHDDELLAAVLDHSQISTSAVDDPAPILAGLSAAHAKRLSDVVTELVEGRLTFAVSSDTGRMRLSES